MGLAEAIAVRTGGRAQAITVQRSLAASLSAYTGIGADLPPAALVIGAGRAGALAAAAARKTGVPAICVMKPPLPGLKFDAVVVPAHDEYRGANVIETVGGLHGLTPNKIQEAAKSLEYPQPLAAILVGGPSNKAVWDAEGEAALHADIQALRAQGFHLVGTASRRTPAEVVQRLHSAFPQMDFWNGDGPNPYPGVLAFADVIVVTSDSVSMISEALSIGRPVVVSGATQTAPKFARFLGSIADRLSPSSGPFLHPKPLDETGRVADEIIAREIIR